MKCYHGTAQSLSGRARHMEGHRVGAVVKMLRYTLWLHWAIDSSSLSDLARLSLDEAFAEGFVNGDPLLLRSVSRYLDADPADVGAPDLVGVNVSNISNTEGR